MITKGIDVSSHQGVVDFQKVKEAGKAFVIIKAGQGVREMSTFKDRYLSAVQAAGLDWGAYWWSDADTVEQAKQEAYRFLAALAGTKPTFPVYMDQEYNTPAAKLGSSSKARQVRTDMCKAFLEVLEDGGYYAGLYSSTDWLNNWLYDKQLTSYDKWVAQYAPRCTYTGVYGMWQHHGDVPGYVGRCDGVGTAVDLNDCYKDYPGIIQQAGLNGWK